MAAVQYLLPCECGAKTPVDAGQAGGSVDCVCGRRLSVPTLRGLRELPTAASTKPSEVKSSWSPLRGMLFSIGIVAALFASVYAGFNLLRWKSLQPYRKDLTAQIDQESDESIDKLSPVKSLEAWKGLTSSPPDAEDLPPWVLASKAADYYLWHGLVGLGVAVAGIAATGGALVARPKAK